MYIVSHRKKITDKNLSKDQTHQSHVYSLTYKNKLSLGTYCKYLSNGTNNLRKINNGNTKSNIYLKKMTPSSKKKTQTQLNTSKQKSSATLTTHKPTLLTTVTTI